MNKYARFSQDDLSAMDKGYRANLINSLSSPKPAVLIATESPSGQTNLAIFTQVFHLGSNPPAVGVIFRPDPENRHTYPNLRRTGKCILQPVTASNYREAHQTAARYPEEVSELTAAGLQVEPSQGLGIVKDSPWFVRARYHSEYVIPINQTVFVVLAIDEVAVKEAHLTVDGFIALEQAKVVAAGGTDAYYRLNLLGRMAYPKPDLPPRTLESNIE